MQTLPNLPLWRIVHLIALSSGIGMAAVRAHTFVVNTPYLVASCGDLLRDGEPGDGVCDIDPDDVVVCPLPPAVEEANNLPRQIQSR